MIAMIALPAGLLDSLRAIEVAPLLRVAALLALGFLLTRLARRVLGKRIEARFGLQGSMILRRFLPGLIWTVVGVTAIDELGFDFKVLLGAAGVLTVAVGFASQTAASNLISGLFLLVERPFVVGDTITVESVTGVVVSVDLLSVKLCTFDNLYVRVPSEALIKNRITNLSRYPIRRFDLPLILDHAEDLERLRGLLLQAAARLSLSLDEPAPAVMFTSFRIEGVELQLSVWASRENYFDLSNALPIEVKRVLEAAGVRVAAPRPLLVGAPRDAVAVVEDAPPPVG